MKIEKNQTGWQIASLLFLEDHVTLRERSLLATKESRGLRIRGPSLRSHRPDVLREGDIGEAVTSLCLLIRFAPDRKLKRGALKITLIRHGTIAILQIHNSRQQL